MNEYIMTKIKDDKFNAIAILLNYRINISYYLKLIIFPELKGGKLLVDTVLCSGMNEYRFIEVSFNDDGTIDMSDYKYVNVDDNILKKANELVSEQTMYVNTSVLTTSQKQIFIEHAYRSH